MTADAGTMGTNGEGGRDAKESNATTTGDMNVDVDFDVEKVQRGIDDDSGAAVALVRVTNGKCLVDDANDVAMLRAKHRIVGTMIGALPGFRSQDVARGLPLELTPEECALCAERGWARVVDARDADVGRWKDLRRGIDAERRASGTSAGGLQDASGGKKRPAAHRSDHRGWGGGGGGAAKKAKANAANVTGWRKVVSGASSFVHVPLHNAQDGDVETTFAYPTTNAERERFAVFKDLHDREFYATSGAKFGSDYLAYPGDPYLFHAHYTVRIVPWDVVIHPLVISATTRMSNTARKNFVFACVRKAAERGDDAYEVRYFTLEADVDLSSNRGY